LLVTILESAPLFLAGVFVLGLLIGSFLNVVILRLPPRLLHDWRSQCREILEVGEEPEKEPPNIWWNRSRCPKCGHGIRAHENVPVLSYLLLGGRCSACRERISARYPAVELTTAVLFLVTAWHFGPSAQCAAALLFTGFLIALTGIDLDHQLLPDSLTMPLLWAGLVLSLYGVFTGPAQSIIGAVAGYLSLWLVYHLFRLLTGKEGMGFGDFKLLGALGAWMGWHMLPLVILFSSLVGAATGLVLMGLRRHGSGQPMPFGPFIAAAGWIALIWGDRIVNYYLAASGLA